MTALGNPTGQFGQSFMTFVGRHVGDCVLRWNTHPQVDVVGHQVSFHDPGLLMRLQFLQYSSQVSSHYSEHLRAVGFPR